MTLPLDTEGRASPPRSNGELVFAEPWESRAFAMAVALCESELLSWNTFQQALIARIASSEGAPYYEQWLGALEDALADLGALTDDDVTGRASTLTRRAPGHDH